MRVLVCPIGSRGDFQPLLALGRTLRGRGHAVAICTTVDFRDWAVQEGFEFLPIALDARKLVGAMGSALHNPLKFGRMLAEQAEVVLEGVGRACVDVDAVVGCGAQGAAPSFCEARQIPYFYALYCPVGLRSDYVPPYPVSVQNLPRFINRLCWSAQDLFFNHALRAPINRVRLGLGLPKIGNAFEHMTRSGVVLAAFDDLLAPLPPDWGADVAATGFWFYDAGEPLAPEVGAFLGAGELPIYVGFGSMPSADAAAQTQLVRDAIHGAHVRAVVGLGWGGLGAARLDESCLCVAAAPHQVLFPRVSVVVHHGGAGTTASAARAGVPQVIVPHMLDQFYWAHRVYTTGLGPAPIPIKRLNAARLADAISHALSDQAMRERCAAYGARLQTSNGLAAAAERIESLAPGGAAQRAIA